MKHHHQAELADAYAKNEESSKEVRKWESMFKEWMQTMEDRVNNINRTHSVLQVIFIQIRNEIISFVLTDFISNIFRDA